MSTSHPKILLIGCDGQVGWELQRSLAVLADVTATSLCGSYGYALDLLNPDAVDKAVAEVGPDYIVNAAAHTAVDKAESEIELSEKLNTEAPAQLARLAAEHNAVFIHYSTDFVFDGESERPYREEDPTAPLGVYGATKLEGELRVLETEAAAMVFRTSWVYGNHGHNFMKTMLRLFRERDELKVVDDQIGAPTWSRMIAEATAQVIGQLQSGAKHAEELKGVYHLTNSGETSWYGFAREILELSGESCSLLPIATHEYPTPARRPAYSVLDNSKLNQVFSLTMPDWSSTLKRCMEDEKSTS
ncbi:MAG: dTDP-4-dehydrorhamnose reductase [Candidatus Thiodiazotropha weberae]|uniref:dTDP-4-dehydrorhamnose reductase n=1 Tax=Candidatus Thiodiazotropha endoloripes TaxID=1818881 RepID=A0A1E2URM9_9GAMM|nr:dTDP-4-dehydrorhamnose reductase [Candidatus Thiodiazotropha endoloripes]MCG7899171.1 dTDP-4-dehydrorhamnose reductase [Candidatus Thiodiazotropha weberae]MCG7903396.1 dTDP-4-dehydrorhamnose reductase [Candidatus Thiodiazotropha weberae]ODB86105.1 dTDP-4-dehydrorhamnose reductase [Candidatus Thiodiazotropha endoloripes]ODB88141.1 dTDP-4-dehydrorhamnose reductase [Candidatus Thiodiazotropha endoloripes]ODB97222.1 dTDP-4-dehydrorhamnose reductase [Candidatus Thiodiazotropha endoloripes]